MVETVTSDLNVILAPLTAAPGADLDNLAQGTAQSMSSDLFRRELAELEDICKSLPEPRKSELASTISSLQANFDPRVGVSASLAVALQEARVQARFFQTEVSSNDAAELSGTLADYKLSAAGQVRVGQQMQAIMDGDIVVIAQRFRSPNYDSLPEPVRAEVDAATQSQLESPYGRRLVGEAQRAQREDPEGFRRALEAMERRKEILDRLIEQEQDPARRGVLSSFLNSNAYAMPNADRFVETAMRGGSVTELNAAATPAYEQLQQSVFGMVSTIRQSNGQQVNDIIAAAPPEMRDRLMHDDRALGVHLIERARTITPEVQSRALLEWDAVQRRGGSFADLSPQTREVFAVQTVMASSTSAITIVGALKQMGRTQELARAQEQGRVLTAEEQAHVDSLRFISDASNPLSERASRLVDATMGSLTSAPTPLLRRMAETRENSTALASLTLAFADRNGGIERFQQMAARMPAPGAAGPVEPEAQAFFVNYQNFLSQTLIGENFNPSDPSQGARLAVALSAAGKELQNGSMEIINGPEGVRLYRPNSLNFDGSTSAFASTDSLLLQATGGTAEMVRRMYAESRNGERSSNPEFVRMIQQIDSYRLQSDPESQQLIIDLQYGLRPLEEIRVSLNARLADEREGMAAFVPSILNRMDPNGRAVLERNGLINDDGSVDLERLMNQVEVNKTRFASVYQRYLGVSDPALLPEGLAEARALREFASQLQSAHAVEHLLVRRDAVESELVRYQNSGMAVPAPLQQEADLIATISGYNPNTATPDQTRVFEGALRTYLMRDEYTAEKERADAATPPPPRRANIIATATATIVDTLRNDPLYFSEHAAEHHDQSSAQAPSEVQPVVTDRIVSNYNSKTPLDSRESEGTSSPLDTLTKTDLERAVLGVLQQMTTEVRFERFAEALGDANNKGDKNFISYNEIEAALIANGWRRPADIDTDHNGVDDQDILRALTTPNQPVNGQGTGRA